MTLPRREWAPASPSPCGMPLRRGRPRRRGRRSPNGRAYQDRSPEGRRRRTRPLKREAAQGPTIGDGRRDEHERLLPTPDGDVTLALRRERAAVPVGEAVLAIEPGESGHQIALGGPDVAEVARTVPRRAVGPGPVVVRGAALADEIVGVEPEVPLADIKRDGYLARREPPHRRHPQLDHEPAPG